MRQTTLNPVLLIIGSFTFILFLAFLEEGIKREMNGLLYLVIHSKHFNYGYNVKKTYIIEKNKNKLAISFQIFYNISYKYSSA